MSLQHILKTIELKTEEEISAIIMQAEERKKNILAEAEEEAKKIAKNARKSLEAKTADKINQAKRKAVTQTKNKLLLKKRVIIDDVFTRAAKKLAKQDNQLKKLYQQLLTRLPVDQSGKIIASEDSMALLKALMNKAGSDFPLSSGLKESGFKFIGETIEIDNRLSRLVETVRDEAEIEISKLLFG